LYNSEMSECEKDNTIVREKPMLHKNSLVVLQNVGAVFFSRKIVYQIWKINVYHSIGS
jgi:hypothetical protein